MPAEPRDVVRTFYEAVANRDGDALAELVASAFHDDAAVEWPAGLPYGGRVEGASVLRKVFAGLASVGANLGPENIEVQAVIDGGDQLAVQLRFDWCANDASIPSGAIELWTFDAGRVKEICAYYWDTAACQALVQDTTTPSA